MTRRKEMKLGRIFCWFALITMLFAIGACSGGGGGGSSDEKTPEIRWIKLSANPGTIVTDSSTPTSSIKAIAVDSDGQPVDSSKVVFFKIVSGPGELDAVSASVSNGEASVNFSSTTPGETIIEAWGGTASTRVTVSSVPQSAYVTSMAVSANPQIILKEATSTIRSVVSNSYGNPVPDTNVYFELISGDGSLSSSVVKSDEQGVAEVEFTASQIVGEVKIRIYAGNISKDVTVMVQSTVPGVVEIALTANPATIPADGNSESEIQAIVYDKNKEPVDGVVVVFEILSGEGTLDNTSVETSKGVAKVNFKASYSVGSTVIRAKVGDVESQVTVQTVTPISTFNFYAEPAIIEVEGSSTLKAILLDNNGVPISGINVFFSISKGTGSIADSSVQTDTNGVAQTQFTATSLAQAVEITAMALSVSRQVVITVQEQVETPASVKVSANPSLILADGASTSTIFAVVQDSDKKFLEGITVLFEITEKSAQGGSLSSPTATTDDMGTASVDYTSSNQVGDVYIKATAGDISEQAVVSQLSSLDEPSKIAMSANPSSIEVGGSSTITAKVTSAGGTAVSGATVDFEIASNGTGSEPGTISPTSTETDGNGEATAVYTGTNANGTIVIKASSLSGRVTGRVNVFIGEKEDPYVNIKPDPGNTEPAGAVINLRGTGQDEICTLAFMIVNEDGEKVTNPYAVNFDIVGGGLNGGENIVTGFESATSEDGVVKTKLQSGIKSGIVQVKAELADFPDINVVGTVVIQSGLPAGNAFGLSVDVLNVPGRAYKGLTQNLTEWSQDFYSNPVREGVQVQFQTDFSAITGSSYFNSTDGGATFASATVTSADPIAVDGFVTVSAQTTGGVFSKVLCLAVDPTNQNIIYAGTDGGGVFKTVDQGKSWSLVGSPLKTVGTSKYVNLTGSIVRQLLIPGSTPNVIYAATNEGIFVSVNSGETWQTLTGFRRVYGDRLFSSGSIYQFNNDHNGNLPRTSVYVNGVRMYPFVSSASSPSGWHLLSSGIGFYDNGQASYRTISGVVTADYDTRSGITTQCYSVAVNPYSYNINTGLYDEIYAGTYGQGVWKSTDGGNRWVQRSAMDNPATTFGSKVLCLALNPQNPVEIFAGSDGDGFFKSVNSAGTWVKIAGSISAPLAESEIRAIALEGSSGSVSNIWLGGKNGISYSSDGGANWYKPSKDVNFNDELNTDVRGLVRDTNDGTLYAVTYGYISEGTDPHGGVYFSDDNGNTWNVMPDPSGTTAPGTNALDSISIYPIPGNDVVVVGCEGRSVRMTDNKGQSWSIIVGQKPATLNNTIFATMKLMHSGEAGLTVYSATANGLYGEAGTINCGSVHQFYVQVCDDLGNPAYAVSTLDIAADKGDPTISHIDIKDAIWGNNYWILGWVNQEAMDEPDSGVMDIDLAKPGIQFVGSDAYNLSFVRGFPICQ